MKNDQSSRILFYVCSYQGDIRQEKERKKKKKENNILFILISPQDYNNKNTK